MTLLHRVSIGTVMSVLVYAASAQSTAFTYQGMLQDAGAPANGTYDVRLRLWDALSSGQQLGTTLCADNVPVANGQLSVTVDFGQQFGTPGGRFLELEVRRDTGLNCANLSGFTLLGPRQLITATPIANHAKSAFSLDGPDGSRPNAVFVDNAGKVGIGTLAPTHVVHVMNAQPTLALQDSDSAGSTGGQQVGFVSFRDSGSVERAWVGFGSPGDPDFSIVAARPGGDIVLSNLGGGNVGIGTPAPLATLDVRGDIRLGSSGQFFAVSGSSNFQIIQGVVAANGGVRSGSGFTVSHPGVGSYTITFGTPFVSAPAVTVTLRSNIFPANRTAVTGTELSNQLIRIGTGTLGGVLEDQEFSFIAIGPR